MKSEEIIEKIKQSGLCGRGGASYPTGEKWEEMYLKKHPQIYICVNGSEGDPATDKDGFILKNYFSQLIEGIKIAYFLFPQTKQIYFYLRKDYFDAYKEKIEALKDNLPLTVFKEPGGYLCGENTVLINSIEGKRLIPRSKPPYCSEVGLWEKPTLVNNIETFFRVYQIINNQYKKTRFYSLNDTKTKKTAVYDLPLNFTIEEVLRKTNFYPSEDFFVQAGGGASGDFFTKEEIKNQKADLGTGAITIYYPKYTSFEDLLKEKINFFIKENCGFCTPCREGIYYLSQIKDKNEKIEEITEIANTLYYTSFCGLGEGAGSLFKSLIAKKDKIWPR